MVLSWRGLCRLCGKTPNECFVDKFPDLRAHAELFHLAQQFLYGSAIWERNAHIPVCFECEKFLSEIYQFSQACIKTRDMLVELRNKTITNEEEIVRHRNAFISGSVVEFVLPLDEPAVEEMKVETSPTEEVEIIIKGEDWIEEPIRTIAEPETLELVAEGPVEAEELEGEEEEQEEPEIEILKVKPGRKKKPKLQCGECPKAFSSEVLLKRHRKSHDRPGPRKVDAPAGEKPFVCEECGKAWATKGGLKEHMSVHIEERAFHCSKCPKAFKNLQRLRIHEDIHTDTLYICTLCGLQLNTRRTLTMHMVVHSDVKNFKCEYCGKEYKRAKALKNHLIIHTGLRPYMCPFCDKTFANGSNCRTHKRKAHPHLLAELEATQNKEELKVKALPSITELKTNLQMKAMETFTIVEYKVEDAAH